MRRAVRQSRVSPAVRRSFHSDTAREAPHLRVLAEVFFRRAAIVTAAA
ncbi:MAG: hypothetical protein KF718_31485 [Polyangiaceae bacterium]|nr:hypothetical protein [Polyangiaceae bacterium]